MGFAHKNWDGHVHDAEQVARGAGFQAVRDRIVELAAPAGGDVVVDLGAGTGLLALSVAGQAQKVWALDSSRAMAEYLQVKAESAELTNLRVVVASVTSVPLVDGVADVVLSNYCFHELSNADKLVALAEAFRLLRPGGRLVIGDLMFTLNPASARDRRIVIDKLLAIGRRGPAGWLRLAKNALRLATGRWEHPQTEAWWQSALERSGFEHIAVELLRHGSGIASASRPLSEPAARAIALSTRRGSNAAEQSVIPAPPDHAAAAVTPIAWGRGARLRRPAW
jgi:ubiquinone/menaquinone biosynthesis C-methylase UbiE